MSTGWGDPDDVEGECNAHCYIGDNYGDGTATMRCKLPKDHEGLHREEFRAGTCVLTWKDDERCYHDKGMSADELTGNLHCNGCQRMLIPAD